MKRISELDNLAHGDIQDADLVEVARTTTKNFKFTWSSLKTALTTLFNTLYSALTHATRHQAGGADVINVAGLSGELADNQPPKAHATSHQLAGADAINVGGLSGELADNQPPKTHATSHQNGGTDVLNVANLSGELTDEQKPKEHSNTKHSTNLVGEAGVIAAMTEKATPVDNDLFVIEDSAASNAVKKLKLSNLPASESVEKILSDFTLGETVAINDALYLKATDGKVWKTDATYNDERIHNFIGFAKEAGNADDVKKVQIGGKVEGFSGLTIGSYYYLSDTAGVISATAGTYRKFCGVAISATEVLLLKEKTLDGSAIASDTLRASDDAEVEYEGTTVTLRKRIRLKSGNLRNATFRIKWQMKGGGGGHTGYAKVFRNGVAIGTAQTATDSTTYVDKSEDIFGWHTGDHIELYLWSSAAIKCYARNFRIYFDSVIPSSPTVDLFG